MAKVHEEWYETIEIQGRLIQRVPKVLRKDAVVSSEIIGALWPSLTPRERVEFAGAFSRKPELNDCDQSVIDFLMQKGEPRIWRTIALLIARYHDRARAVDFLLARIKEGVRPLANYYQAIGLLSAWESVPVLRNAFSRHREEVALRPTLEIWSNRFIYLDYLSCAATLLTITGQEEYRADLSKMQSHPDEVVRRMIRTVATACNVKLNR
jgi:hypothetical protein